MAFSLGASCPRGGSFYICEHSQIEFVGCCTSNPCTTAAQGKCPTSNIRPASFSSDSYHDIPPQQCDSTDPKALWFTCAANTPPFMGCCKSNPCVIGSCDTNDLVPARLSSDAEDRQAFLGEASISTTSTTSTTSSQTATPTSTSEGSSTSSAPPAPSEESGGLPMAAIIGIAVGGAVILLAVIAFFIIRRRRNSRHDSSREDQIAAFVTGGRGGEYKPVSTFSTSEPSHTPRPYSPPSNLAPYSARSHLSPYPSPLNSAYDPHASEAKMRAISQISEVSDVSHRSTNTYSAYQPSSIAVSPNLSELSPNATGAFGGQVYSELPAEERGGRQKPGVYQELQG